LNESFSANISATTSDVYDVKIFVQNNQTAVIISEIYNDGWKNSYYYIKSAFPSQSSFLIRIKNYSTDSAICIRLRKTDSSSYSERCGKITIVNIAVPPANSPSYNASSGQEKNLSQNFEQTSKDFIPASAEDGQKSQDLYNQSSSEKILLSSKKNSEETFISSEGKLRNYILYFFMALVIILCIYLAFKKL
jgi:hypothetical protein